MHTFTGQEDRRREGLKPERRLSETTGDSNSLGSIVSISTEGRELGALLGPESARRVASTLDRGPRGRAHR